MTVEKMKANWTDNPYCANAVAACVCAVNAGELVLDGRNRSNTTEEWLMKQNVFILLNPRKEIRQ